MTTNDRAQTKTPTVLARVLRGLRYALFILIGGALFYLIGVNAFLSFGGLALLFKSTNSVNATFERAYTLWPGVVHVRNLRIVFQDQNLEWSLDIERVTAKITLHELARRRFHATRVEGEGAAFRMRHRIEPESKNEPWVGALPSIPEFPAPAVFEARVPEAPIPDSKYNLWTVHLEHVDVGVKEAWVQFVRYLGKGRARGAFRLVAARTLWVGPASLNLEPGTLWFGAEPIASSLSGRLGCKVDFFDVRVPKGREVLRYINADIGLAAERFRFEPFVQFFASTSEFELRAAPGALNIGVRVRRGQLLEGSAIQYASREVSFEKGAVSVEAGDVVLRSELEQAARARTTLTLDSVTLGASPLPIRFERTRATLFSQGDDLTGDFSVLSKELAVGGFTLENARSLNGLFGRKAAFVFDAGVVKGTLFASSPGASDALNGRLELSLRGVEGRSAELRARADGKLNFDFEHSSTPSTRAKLRLAGEFPKLTFRLLGKGKGLAHGELLRAKLHAHLEQNRARVSGEFALDAAALAAESGSAEQMERLAGSKLAVHGSLDGARRRMRGELSASLGTLELHSQKQALAMSPTLHVSLHDFDSTRVSGRVDAALSLNGWNATYADDGGQCSTLALPAVNIEVASVLERGLARSRVSGEVRGATLVWGDFRAQSNARFFADVRPLDAVPGAQQVMFSAHLLELSLQSGAGGARGWAAKAPDLTLEADARLDDLVSGSLEVHAPHASGRVGAVDLTTGFSADLRKVSFDPATRALRFGGRLRFDDTGIDAGARRVQAWWAVLDVNSALASIGENLDLSALFRATLRDATPGLAILASDEKVPDYLADLVPLRQLTTEGMVARRCRLTAIQLTSAAGGPLLARGRLESTSDSVHGAFLVRLAALQALSLGVELGPPDAGISLLAGDDWLRERSEKLANDARRVLAMPCAIEPERCSESGPSAQK